MIEVLLILVARSRSGHTLGVVALEDVLEELVGEIRDEMQRRVA